MSPSTTAGSRPKPSRAVLRARKDRAHDKYVQKTYGLAPGEYDEILARQDGRCAMCRRKPRRRRLAVDHNHDTGKVRALLCQRCNQYLGHWEFDPIAAYNAAIYLAAIAADYGDTYGPEALLLQAPATAAPPRPGRLPPLTIQR